jgi:hypothetical protein
MLKVATVPVLTRMLAKLDISPIVERLKKVDIFKTPEDAKEAVKELDPEKVGVVGAEIIAEIMPQIDKIGVDIPEFIALYKGVSIKEANELDFAVVLNELINDEGIRSFFSVALRRKVERES